jgi:PAS domain S-box-containing protein
MAVLKPSGEFLRANPALTRLLGHDEGRLLGTNIMSLIHADDLDDLGKAWEEMAEASTPTTSWMRCRTSEGHAIWGRVSLSLVPRSSRQPATVLLHLEDETELYEERRDHESLIKGRDEFVVAIGNEIRKPLREILDLAAQTDGDHLDLHSTVLGIEAHARESASIVADLIVSARADTTPVPVLARTVDAGLLCREALAGVPGADDITVEVRATAMWADPGLTKRIVSSLLGAATRYGGTTVSLETTSSGPDTLIDVINNGPGIPISQRERIFSGDLRSGQPVTRPAAVGLSLTVARHLARQMDGDITYRRTEDGHNVFELRLPSERIASVGLEPIPIPA